MTSAYRRAAYSHNIRKHLQARTGLASRQDKHFFSDHVRRSFAGTAELHSGYPANLLHRLNHPHRAEFLVHFHAVLFSDRSPGFTNAMDGGVDKLLRSKNAPFIRQIEFRSMTKLKAHGNEPTLVLTARTIRRRCLRRVVWMTEP